MKSPLYPFMDLVRYTVLGWSGNLFIQLSMQISKNIKGLKHLRRVHGKMKIIEFKRKHIDFLSNHLVNDSLKSKFVTNDYSDTPSRRVTKEIEFSDQEIECALNELTNLLSSSGFDKNEKLNDLGAQTEDIIDLFSNQMFNSQK